MKHTNTCRQSSCTISIANNPIFHDKTNHFKLKLYLLPKVQKEKNENHSWSMAKKKNHNCPHLDQGTAQRSMSSWSKSMGFAALESEGCRITMSSGVGVIN